MSFFGKNIKKIRSVQNMSQQAFSELFDLKRATLGAYEEQRSEPRIDTIIKIANYFSISIDDLLTNELTVNDLLKFKGDFTTDAGKMAKASFPEISCVTDELTAEYPFSFHKKEFLEGLPKIQLPIPDAELCRGFVVRNLEMTHHDRGFYPKDIVIAQQLSTKNYTKLTNGEYGVVITADSVIFRRCYITSNKMVLRADHKNIEDVVLPLTELKELWVVKYVFCKRVPDFSDMIEGRLTLIQQELQKLQESLR